MFKCFGCKKTQPQGEKQVKYITSSRKRSYENVVRRGKKSFTIKSEGWEIVSEVPLCRPCFDAHDLSKR